MSQNLNTYGRLYLAASYGRPAEVLGETYSDRMEWVESRAAEVAAEIATSRSAKLGTRDLATASTYSGRYVLNCERVTVSASAPTTVTHSGQRPALRPYSVPRGWVAPKDLLSRCTAAARLTLTGRQWSREDAAECASAIMLSTLERHPLNTGYVDPDAASMARLAHLAANWRRGQDRQRQRDATDAANRAGITGKVYATVTDGVTASPMTAARTAIHALQNLGLGPTAARRVWPLAYTVARATEDVDGATIAAELNMSHDGYRQAVSRAKKMIHPDRRYSPDGMRTVTDDAARLLAAVCAECEAIATDPRAVATDAADAPDWPARSAKRYKGAPITVRRDASVKRDGRRNYPPADWAQSLAPNTRRRLETASRMARERASGRTAAETETRRLAAGLPATVR